MDTLGPRYTFIFGGVMGIATFNSHAYNLTFTRDVRLITLFPGG